MPTDEKETETDDKTEETAVEKEQKAPIRGEVVPDRFSSDEVFQRIAADADHEINSSSRQLFFSALAAGLAISITVLLYVTLQTKTDSPILAALLYPIGFIYIIIGGYQLYTENTLPPVALVLERLASVPSLLRHWFIVAAGNFAGGALGAIALVYGGVFSPEAREIAVHLGEKGLETGFGPLFTKGAFAGLIVAGGVWVDFSARDTISRVIMVYLAFLCIPLGNLFHVVVSFTEATYLLLVSDYAIMSTITSFVLPVLLGNTFGGVILVALVNYYQTSEDRLDAGRFENARKLTISEWLFGRFAGRSYVPVIDTAEDSFQEPEDYRILVPLTEPRASLPLVKLACELASDREQGIVHVVNLISAPRNIDLDDQKGHRDRLLRQSREKLASLSNIPEQYEITFETSTIVTMGFLPAIFDRARRTAQDLVLMEWDRENVSSAARAEQPLYELTNQLPCDFLVAKDRGLNTERILVPTAGGPESELSTEVARSLASVSGSEVTLFHVSRPDSDPAPARQMLDEWASEYDLNDAELKLVEAYDVGHAIQEESKNHTMVILGASEQGIISRMTSGTVHRDLISRIDCSLIIAERPTDRSFLERLLG